MTGQRSDAAAAGEKQSSAGIDIIGIGAINIDFIFSYRPGKDEPPGGPPDQGPEDLGADEEQLANQILRRFHQKPDVTTQVGGSAFLAIRTAASTQSGLKCGYVGVIGTPDDLELEVCPGLDVTGPLAELGDRSWLFESISRPGRARVFVRRGKRVGARVAPGANKELLKRVLAREAEGEQLYRYLASARWVHLTSLSRFADFAAMIDRVQAAKMLNPGLRCSIDPGYEYCTKHAGQLKDLIGDVAAVRHGQALPAIVDYVFLGESEANHLAGGGRKVDRHLLTTSLEAVFGKAASIVVVKHKACHTITHKAGEARLTRTYWHPRLSFVRIHNDTGAGDAFAGGFIAAHLIATLAAYQPAPIRLGALLAAERLKSADFPDAEISTATRRFLYRNQRNERLNLTQRLGIMWEDKRSLLTGFLVGVSSSIVATLILLRFGI